MFQLPVINLIFMRIFQPEARTFDVNLTEYQLGQQSFDEMTDQLQT